MHFFVKRKALGRFSLVIAALLMMPSASYAQSDLTAIVRGSEILVGGLITLFSSSKTNSVSTTVESVCIKNKMNDKITLILTRQTEDGDDIKKELVIPQDSKECFYDLPKGVYSYEILLSDDTVYKKGEYRFKSKTVITLKEDPKEAVDESEPNENTTSEENQTETTTKTKTPTG
ncbi:hypothetical protein [Flavobacterium sp.]|uniref:hypothetical protein n=1 Tax=Flavobacterium sp. TaxID=239 RepID=UPI002FDE0096